MNDIICGEVEFDGNMYKFDYRNNIIVLIPEKLENYLKWRFEQRTKSTIYERKNIEGKTNMGYYVCFLRVKFSELGSGTLKAFVPGYIICRNNTINPLPKFENIEKIRFYGDPIDSFFYPKNNITFGDITSQNIKIELEKIKSKNYTINKDKYTFGINWKIIHKANLNQVFNIYSYLDIKFYENKDINQVIDYYTNVSKFFSFINNRKHIKFENVYAYKKELVDYGFGDEVNVQETQIEFEIHIIDSDENISFEKSSNIIKLKEIEEKFVKLYKIVTNKDYLTEYYPLSKKDDYYIDNQKFNNVSSAFESEFDKLFPNFKSSTIEEYNEVKKMLLTSLCNKRKKTNKLIQETDCEDKRKYLKNIIKKSNYFSKIIIKIEGTLEEKIIYSLEKYSFILNKVRQNLMSYYNIKKLKNGTLASKFSKRRNDISHGNYTNSFLNTEIIAYELIRICIYSLTLERCGFSNDRIKIIIADLF